MIPGIKYLIKSERFVNQIANLIVSETKSRLGKYDAVYFKNFSNGIDNVFIVGYIGENAERINPSDVFNFAGFDMSRYIAKIEGFSTMVPPDSVLAIVPDGEIEYHFKSESLGINETGLAMGFIFDFIIEHKDEIAEHL